MVQGVNVPAAWIGTNPFGSVIHMPLRRGALGLVLAVVVALVASCGWADDNYTNAQAQLDRSNPNVTVNETTTTGKPFTTIPRDKVEAIPVSTTIRGSATPDGGGPGTSGTAGAGTEAPAPGTLVVIKADGSIVSGAIRRPDGAIVDKNGVVLPGAVVIPALPTTTTQPPRPPKTESGPPVTTKAQLPVCAAFAEVQNNSFQLAKPAKVPLSQYKLNTALVFDRFDTFAALLPADLRGVGQALQNRGALLRAAVLAAPTALAVHDLIQQFQFTAAGDINSMLRSLAFICPELFPEGFKESDSVQLSVDP